MRSRSMLLGVAAAVVVSCSFATYSIDTCDVPPGGTLANDPCNRLNGSLANAKQRYACDTTTKSCVVKPLDFDRDEDPDPRAGGKDCDDEDPDRASTLKDDRCDGKDNDCSGISDEGLIVVPPPVKPTLPAGSKPIAFALNMVGETPFEALATAAGETISVQAGAQLAAIVTPPEIDQATTREHVLRSFTSVGGAGLVYVRSRTCPAAGAPDAGADAAPEGGAPDAGPAVIEDVVAFKNTAGGITRLDESIDGTCRAVRVRAPTFEPFDGDARAIELHYEAERSACTTPAVLRARWFDAPATRAPQTTGTSTPLAVLAEDAIGQEPVAIIPDPLAAPGAATSSRVVIAQTARGIALWSVRSRGGGAQETDPSWSAIPAEPLASIKDSQHLAAALARTPAAKGAAQIAIGVVTAAGCPSTKGMLTVFRLGPTGVDAASIKSVDIPFDGELSRSAIAHHAGRKEWWILLATTTGMKLVRAALDASKVEAPLPLGVTGPTDVAVRADGLIRVATAADIVDLMPGCPGK